MDARTWRGVALGLLVALLVVVGIGWLPSLGWAPQGLIRVGVVDWEQVLVEYDDFQQAMSELEQREQNLTRNPSENFSAESDTAPENLEQIEQELEKQLQDQHREVVRNHQDQVLEAIEQEAIRQGYSLVLSEQDVLYASDQYTDLTPQVIKRLNESN